jgi:hypothetical protein
VLKFVAVAVIGVAAPLFVSTPLSAADTHGGTAAVSPAPVAAGRM